MAGGSGGRRARERPGGGLRAAPPRRWTAGEERIIAANLEAPLGDLQELLPGRGRGTIKSKARKMGRRGRGRGPVYVDGYTIVPAPGGGWDAAHRIAAAERLGRPLGAGEIVHHINCDRGDDSPGNLAVMGREGRRRALESLNRAAGELMRRGELVYDRRRHEYGVAGA